MIIYIGNDFMYPGVKKSDLNTCKLRINVLY